MSGFVNVLLHCGVGFLLIAHVSGDLVGDGTVCCQDLGCFPYGGEFHDLIHRPVNNIPDCTLPARLFLRLNTIFNPVVTQVLNPYDTNSIRNSSFKAKKPTKILIHGFLDKYSRPAWEGVKTALLADDDYNVIRVDWSQGNLAPYSQACANLRLVGAYVAKFVDLVIREYGVKPENVHIIGHSLGAHGAGYAGLVLQTRYNATLGRITGLDPAGPYYTNMPVSVRLDPSDAAVVDTLVTNGDVLMAFGSSQPMGHINFYPNGGLNQPGCNKAIFSSMVQVQNIGAPLRMVRDLTAANSSTPPPSLIVVPSGPQALPDPFQAVAAGVPQLSSASGSFASSPSFSSSNPFDSLMNFGSERAVVLDTFDVVGCSHNRAVLLFAEAAGKTSCILKAYQCDSFETYMGADEECSVCNGTNHGCSPIGFRANVTLVEKNKQKKFYSVTTGRSPYCSNLKIQFTLANNKEGTQVGKVFVTIFGTAATVKKLPLTPSAVDLIPGKTYTYYPELNKDIGTPQGMTIQWEVKSNLFGSLAGSINPFAKKPFITLNGDLLVTDIDDMIYVMTPATVKIESGKEVATRKASTFEL